MKRTPSIIILIAFLANSFGPVPQAHADEFYLPAPGVMVNLSPEYSPAILKGIKIHPDNPFRFDFILDKGDSQAGDSQLKDESSKLIKYFLASLTIPEKDLWVNLSPYEKDRIVPKAFGLTEMGRDLLAEDYMLKQITASLIYPEGETGKRFWKKIYEEAARKFGTTDIPVNTFNKVWIVPEKAVVYENAKAGTAYVVESKLKVMLEQDYLSLEKHNGVSVLPQDDVNALGSRIVRSIVIPELSREVNEDRNFVQLRQVYNSLILATWYKKKIRDSILERVYGDKNKVAGILSSPDVLVGDPEQIYQRYLQAFKKGAFNYIKEESDPVTQETVPRKYFSGGVDFAMNGHTTMKGINGLIQITHVFRGIFSAVVMGRLEEVEGDFQPSGVSLPFPAVDVPQGYSLIGGEKDLPLAARLQKTMGLPSALLDPKVYSPFQDNKLTLKFMDTISSYVKNLKPGALENKVFRVLEIGSGTGLGAMTAFHQAKLRGFQVEMDALDINDESVENTQKNFELLRNEITDQDSVHIFKVPDDGQLNGLSGQYDLILFYAPDAMPKEKLNGANPAVQMDQEIFKKILGAIADRLLAQKGAAIIGVQKDALTSLIPESLKWSYTGNEEGVYLAGQRYSRGFYQLSFKDQAMMTAEKNLGRIRVLHDKVTPADSHGRYNENSLYHKLDVKHRKPAPLIFSTLIGFLNYLENSGSVSKKAFNKADREKKGLLDYFLKAGILVEVPTSKGYPAKVQLRGFAFYDGEFVKNDMAPEALINALNSDVPPKGIVPALNNPINSLNMLLQKRSLYNFMRLRPEAVMRRLLPAGRQLPLSEIIELNRTLLEANYPSITPKINRDEIIVRPQEIQGKDFDKIWNYLQPTEDALAFILAGIASGNYMGQRGDVADFMKTDVWQKIKSETNGILGKDLALDFTDGIQPVSNTPQGASPVQMDLFGKDKAMIAEGVEDAIAVTKQGRNALLTYDDDVEMRQIVRNLKKQGQIQNINFKIITRQGDLPGIIFTDWQGTKERIIILAPRELSIDPNIVSGLANFIGLPDFVGSVQKVADLFKEYKASFEDFDSTRTHLPREKGAIRMFGMFLQDEARERSPRHWVAVFMDIDNFGFINKSSGQIKGDETLSKFANFFKKKKRGRDILARLGGEEFGLIMPFGNMSENRRSVVDRLLHSVTGEVYLDNSNGEVTNDLINFYNNSINSEDKIKVYEMLLVQLAKQNSVHIDILRKDLPDFKTAIDAAKGLIMMPAGMPYKFDKWVITLSAGALEIDVEDGNALKKYTNNEDAVNNLFQYLMHTANKLEKEAKNKGRDRIEYGRFEINNDQAMEAANGGIDLTPSRMNLQVKNSGDIRFRFDPALLAQLRNAPGFVPVIINIHPMDDLKSFLGIVNQTQ